MWPDTRICKLFGVTHPIILSPMAGSGGPELANAVSSAGGLGSLPCASLMPDEIREHVTAVRQNTSKPLSLNFFCHEFLGHDESVEQAWLDILQVLLVFSHRAISTRASTSHWCLGRTSQVEQLEQG